MSLIEDQVLQKIIFQLKDEFKPTKIYLFGSHARRQQTESSDYDLVVVVKDSSLGQIDRAVRAQQITWTFSGADIFIYTEDEFNDLTTRYGSVAHTALNEGLQINV